MYQKLVDGFEARKAMRKKSSESPFANPDPSTSSRGLSSVSLDPAVISPRRRSSTIRFSDVAVRFSDVADLLLSEADELLDKPDLTRLFGFLTGGRSACLSDDLKVGYLHNETDKTRGQVIIIRLIKSSMHGPILCPQVAVELLYSSNTMAFFFASQTVVHLASIPELKGPLGEAGAVEGLVAIVRRWVDANTSEQRELIPVLEWTMAALTSLMQVRMY